MNKQSQNNCSAYWYKSKNISISGEFFSILNFFPIETVKETIFLYEHNEFFALTISFSLKQKLQFSSLSCRFRDTLIFILRENPIFETVT